MQAAKSMAEQSYVSQEEAQGWLDRHKRTYKVFHAWADEVARISTARGWINNAQGRVRFLNEASNSAKGESPGRLGVSHSIQGLIASSLH